MIARLALIVMMAGAIVLPGALTSPDSAHAATTKKKKKTSGTSADRAKLMEIARQVCRKKYGAGSSVYRLDYTRRRVVCAPPGY
jgi:hypothetical protein